MPSKYGVRMRRPKPGGQPEPEEHDQQDALGGDADHEHPQQPQRPPPAGQHRGQRGRHDQPQRQRCSRATTARPIIAGAITQPPQQPHHAGTGQVVPRGLVAGLDPAADLREVAVGQERVVASRRTAGRAARAPPRPRAPRPARARSGGAGRSRRRRGRPPTAASAPSAAGRCGRPGARRPGRRRGAPPGRAGSSSRCRRRGSARRRPGPAAAARVRRRWP